MLATQKRLQILILLVAGSLVALGATPQAHAIGYTLTTSVARTQESNTPGVVLTLNVTGASVSTTYKFTWVVTDPTNHNANAANQTTTTATQTSFVLSVDYPSQFGGTNIDYVGNYTVNVQENNPVSIPSVATGRFLVGLTDSISYARTSTASIVASGYANNSPVTLNISHQGSPAPGYPKTVTASPTGTVSAGWAIPASVPTGIWYVSLLPAKSIADNQTITILAANVTIPRLNIAQATLQRMQTQSFSFDASYPNGSSVRVGSGQITITESNGTTLPLQATYNSTLSAFSVLYRVPISAPTGVWTAAIQSNAFNDGYGNLGPIAILSGSFSIDAINITISQLNIGQVSLARTQAQTVSFKATYQNGIQVQTGSAQVTMTETDGTTSFSTQAVYNSTLGTFHASYRIPPDSETGAWVASIDADAFNDGFGNLGPSASVVRAFTVVAANLTVSASIPGQTYTLGQVVPIYAIIVFPDGSLFRSGNVTAVLSSATAQIGTTSLTFVPGQSQWVGTYTVKSGDPSGLLLVTLKVIDSYGNGGQETVSAIINVPPPAPAQQPLDLYYFLLAALAIGSGGSGLLLVRRINPTHGGFDEFFRLTGGEIPTGTTLLILGEPGSGSSTLTQELIHHQLEKGGRCGLLTYDAFPSEVSRAMRSFGWDPTLNLSDGTFKILDCYSALAGAENAPIRDPVDFTEISIQVSSMIEKASPKPLTLVVDSITPLFNSAPSRTVINFLRVVSAKLKSNNGILMLTAAKGSIPEEVRSNLETTVDGVVDLSIIHSGQSVIRRLTVSRLAGRKISSEPTEFDIVPGKGILFRKLRIPLGIISPKRKAD